MLFGRRKSEKKQEFDKNGKYPVIRASICTGEKVAGFKNIGDGKFEELMLIRNDSDFREFLLTYGVTEEEVKKEW